MVTPALAYLSFFALVVSKVMSVVSDTFCDPLIQKILRNQPSSRIKSVLRCSLIKVDKKKRFPGLHKVTLPTLMTLVVRAHSKPGDSPQLDTYVR